MEEGRRMWRGRRKVEEDGGWEESGEKWIKVEEQEESGG